MVFLIWHIVQSKKWSNGEISLISVFNYIPVTANLLNQSSLCFSSPHVNWELQMPLLPDWKAVLSIQTMSSVEGGVSLKLSRLLKRVIESFLILPPIHKRHQQGLTVPWGGLAGPPTLLHNPRLKYVLKKISNNKNASTTACVLL